MKNMLKDFDILEVENFINYVNKLKEDKKNYWAGKKTDEWFVGLFKKVKAENMVIDGKHITIQNIGISYDYIAYKNKMLLVYPETKMVFSEVYEGDDFSFTNENGIIAYKHKFANPFEKNLEKVIGLYCIIKNKRGNFITFLNKEEITKHRKVAKTDYIWKAWELEMMYKTIIKKAVRVHFDDTFTGLDEEDNKQIELEEFEFDLNVEKVRLAEMKTMQEVNEFNLMVKACNGSKKEKTELQELAKTKSKEIGDAFKKKYIETFSKIAQKTTEEEVREFGKEWIKDFPNKTYECEKLTAESKRRIGEIKPKDV